MKSSLLKWCGFTWFDAVSPATLRADAFAGATGAAVVLPQAVAFAAIAGLPPEYGLYTAIVTPVIAALFGSSMIMVSGPTTAISALVFSALSGIAPVGSPEFIQSAIALALLVGLIQLAFAIARVGRVAGFVSHSVMVGFIAAAALQIGIAQLGPALGIEATGGSMFARVQSLLANLPKVNGLAIACAGVTLIAAIAFRRFLPRWPGFLLALIAGSALPHLPGAPSDVRFIDAIPVALPVFHMPAMGDLAQKGLIESAFAIAIIGLLEAITIGRSFSYKTGADFSSNREVLGQGLSNVAGGLFQCMPASGSFTRSALNLEVGAKTPLAAIFSALFLSMIALAFRPFMSMIPIAAIAGLILYVAWRLVDFRELAQLISTSRTETGVVGLTFLAGGLASLEFAVYVGVLASLFVFLRNSARPAMAIGAPDPSSADRRFRNAELFSLSECPVSIVIRFDGPVFFGSADFIDEEFRRILLERPQQLIAILILKGVGGIDLHGCEVLMREIDRRRALGGDVMIVASYPPLVTRLRKYGLIEKLGEDHLCESKRIAVARAVADAPSGICASCKKRVYLECEGRPGGAEKGNPYGAHHLAVGS